MTSPSNQSPSERGPNSEQVRQAIADLDALRNDPGTMEVAAENGSIREAWAAIDEIKRVLLDPESYKQEEPTQ